MRIATHVLVAAVVFIGIRLWLRTAIAGDRIRWEDAEDVFFGSLTIVLAGWGILWLLT